MSTYRRDSLFRFGLRFHSGGNSNAAETYCWDQRQQRANGLQTILQWHTPSIKATSPQPLQTLPPPGDQVFKCPRTWGTYPNYHKRVIAASAVLRDFLSVNTLLSILLWLEQSYFHLQTKNAELHICILPPTENKEAYRCWQIFRK